MSSKVYLFEITPKMAADKDIPTKFKAAITRNTDKAIYVSGFGFISGRSFSRCIKCGRTLTHPGSIILGIGPECLGSWTARKVAMDSLTEEDIQAIQKTICEKKVDCWLPKYCVISQVETDETAETAKEETKAVIAKTTAPKMAFLAGAMSIGLKFGYDADLVGKVRAIQGRKWNALNKFWIVPATPKTVDLLKSWGFEIPEDIIALFATASGAKAPEIDPILENGFNGNTLMPFQKDGIKKIYERNGRIILGDEQGLGKTIQTLAYLGITNEWPALVVCPASVKFKWKEEAQKWLGNIPIEILSGRTPKPIGAPKIIIANYNIIQNWADVLCSSGIKVLLLDEVQKISEDKNLCTKAIKKIAKGIPHVIPISGTPAKSRPMQLYNAVRLVDPNIFPSRFQFGIDYCNGHQTMWGWDFKGSSNEDKLHELLSPILVRRLKREVLKDLPDKLRSIIPMEITNRKEYNAATADFLAWLHENKGAQAAAKASEAEAIVKIGALRFLAVKGIIKEATEWIKDFLDGGDAKLIVFAIHKEIISHLMDTFGDIAVKIDGSVAPEKRNDIVKDFQENPKIRLFVGNIKAAGEGITLTASSNVAFLELPWTPGDLLQAEDRAHRIGQTKGVNIWYLVPQNTIAEKMAEILSEKARVLSSVIDGGVGKNVESDMLSSVLDTIYLDDEQDAKAG